jgi:cardiolipin synthase
MRLNFELNLECYDGQLGADMKAWFRRRLEVSTEVTKADIDGRSLPRRLRDSVARLFSPYL